MIKKYFIRIVGALCILGALALMFLPAWVQLDGVDRGDLKDLRKDISGVCDTAADAFTYRLEDEDFKEELKDCDLPYTKSSVKAQFKDLEKLAGELLNDTVSLKELLTLSLEVPGIAEKMENMLDSEIASRLFFNNAASYTMYRGSQADPDAEYTPEDREAVAEELTETTEESMELISEITPLLGLLAAVLIVIIALGVLSAITHVCNKGRWVKYLFLVILAGMVAGSIVAFPMVSEMVAEMMVDMPMFEDVALKMTAAPYIALVLTIAPIVLDIIFERKKQRIAVEE